MELKARPGSAGRMLRLNHGIPLSPGAGLASDCCIRPSKENTCVTANPTNPVFCAVPAIFIAFQKKKIERFSYLPILKCFGQLDKKLQNVLVIIFFNFLDVLNFILCMFSGTVDDHFSISLIESSSTETALHTTTQPHSHVFLIGAAKVSIKGKIMLLFFSVQIPYDYAGRGSSVESLSCWHASGPKFDPHVQHIPSIWS